jgi:hypothetical protein
VDACLSAFVSFKAAVEGPDRPHWNHWREADSHSVSQEVPRLLWNPMVHCRVHTGPCPEHVTKCYTGLGNAALYVIVYPVNSH